MAASDMNNTSFLSNETWPNSSLTEILDHLDLLHTILNTSFEDNVTESSGVQRILGAFTEPDNNTMQEVWLRNFFTFYLESPATRVKDRVYMWTKTVWLTVMLVAGLVGNLFAMVIMARPSMRHQPINSRFFVLAFCDFCCCFIRVITWANLLYAFRGLPVPIKFDNDALCKFSEYVFTSIHISESWMVTYITLERAVHIVFPFKGTEFCKPSLGKLAMPVCVIGPFVVMSYLPVVTRFVPGVGCATRAYPEMYYHFVTATAGVSMLPLTIIFACNMTIVASLHRQKGNLTSDPKRSVRFRRVTNMIIAVSVAFLATVFPQAANALMTINHPTWAWLRVSDDVTAILWELNYAINFYLYIITGRSVRREIMQILSCGRGQTKGEDRKRQAKGEDSNKTSTTNT